MRDDDHVDKHQLDLDDLDDLRAMLRPRRRRTGYRDVPKTRRRLDALRQHLRRWQRATVTDSGLRYAPPVGPKLHALQRRLRSDDDLHHVDHDLDIDHDDDDHDLNIDDDHDDDLHHVDHDKHVPGELYVHLRVGWPELLERTNQFHLCVAMRVS